MLKNIKNDIYSLYQQGFSLVELMIVVAIIGILAALAIPQYQSYVMKTQLTRAYYELRATTTVIETVLAFGHMPTLDKNLNNKTINGVSYEYVGLDNQHATSDLLDSATLDADDTNFYAISAKFSGHATPALTGTVITLSRADAGTWTCQIEPYGSAAHQTSIFQVGGCTLKS